MLQVYSKSFEHRLHETYAIHSCRGFHIECTDSGEVLGTDTRLHHSMRRCSHLHCVHTDSRFGS